jgi:hypothetical protein
MRSLYVGHKACDGLTVPGNHDLLAAFDAVKQTPKRVLRFKSADYTNTGVGVSHLS